MWLYVYFWKFTKLRILLVCVLFITYVILQELSSFFKREWAVPYQIYDLICKRQIVLSRWVNERMDNSAEWTIWTDSPCDTIWEGTVAVVWNSLMGYRVYASLCSNRVRNQERPWGMTELQQDRPCQWRHQRFPSLDVGLARTDDQLEAVRI